MWIGEQSKRYMMENAPFSTEPQCMSEAQHHMPSLNACIRGFACTAWLLALCPTLRQRSTKDQTEFWVTRFHTGRIKDLSERDVAVGMMSDQMAAKRSAETIGCQNGDLGAPAPFAASMNGHKGMRASKLERQHNGRRGCQDAACGLGCRQFHAVSVVLSVTAAHLQRQAGVRAGGRRAVLEERQSVRARNGLAGPGQIAPWLAAADGAR